MRQLLTFQPMVGTIDQANLVYLADGADPTGAAPDINEADRIDWIPLAEVPARIVAGEILGAGSVTALLAVLLEKATARP